MKLPNVVLLVMDACRADHLSCYGYERLTTPNIDRIAANGTLYENAISPGVWTVPSHASMFTGMYLSGHGLYGRNLKLRDDIPTMASFLKRNGYQTAAFTANTLIGHPTGLARGFQDLKDMRSVILKNELTGWQKKINILYRKLYFGPNPGEGTWYDNGAWRINWEVKRWLKKWMKSGQTRPFFFFANYMETHLAYHPPRGYREKFLTVAQQKRWREVNQNPWKYISGDTAMSAEDWDILCRLYDAELAYVDQRIGELYAYLDRHQLLENTIFIVTSDHGENLGEHGLMDHQYCVYDTLLHVPFVAHHPHYFGKGERIKELVQTLDIFPTLVEILQKEDDPTLNSLQGVSLLAVDGAEEKRPFTISEYLAPQLHSFKRESITFDSYFTRKLRALRTQTHKFIWASDGSHELYDLAVDPLELNNIVEGNASLAAHFAQQLQQWLDEYGHAQEQTEMVNDEIVQRLEALGYVE